MSSMAEAESSSISQNVAMGIRYSFQQGKPMINCSYFLGYDKVKGKLVINPSQAATVRFIYRAYLEGFSIPEIAKKLKVVFMEDYNVSLAEVMIPAAEMSRQITDFLNLVMSVTRECLGATDAMSGNVKPDNTSAIMVLQTNAEVPLENIRAELHEWTEDIGRILLDMMGTYYGWRMVEVKREIQELVTGPDGLPRIDPMTGMFQMQKNTIRVPEPFDFTAFKNLWFNLRVDVGGTTYFSETAITQTLDNLRAAGLLSAVQYLERVPDKLIPRKEELLEELRGQAASLEGGASAPAGPIQGGPVSEATAARGVPPAMDSVLKQVNSQIQNKALNLGARRMMG